MPEQRFADIILPLSAETQVLSRCFSTVPPSSAWQSFLIKLSRGHCRRVTKCQEERGSNLYVQGVRHTHPKVVKQVFAQAKQLSRCLTQALQADWMQTNRGSSLQLLGTCSKETLQAPKAYSATVEQRQVI